MASTASHVIPTMALVLDTDSSSDACPEKAAVWGMPLLPAQELKTRMEFKSAPT